ncbi:DUF4199 domain-containing protein [Danxiaibacter flavus]|uniref:DUF4199 domain-containing protein n=1 Tax=Danxiaibacter flavus TaxID=3049108 RepID=A0ABV3ZN99_9BACT|nr:DUF4199 domain-containing protein [Chitinophagaceae bacterium DXS]
MEKKVTTPVVKGIIITLILIVFGLVIYFTGNMQNKVLGSVQYAILCVGIIWACINYANQMDGYVTFGNIFAHGFKTTAVVIALLSVYTFLALKFIFPDMIDQALEQARKEMESKNQMSDEQIEKGLEIGRKYFVPFVIGGLVLFFAIIGAIGSAIGAAVAKKKPQDPFSVQQPM